MTESFVTGKRSTARRPSRIASSLWPRYWRQPFLARRALRVSGCPSTDLAASLLALKNAACAAALSPPAGHDALAPCPRKRNPFLVTSRDRQSSQRELPRRRRARTPILRAKVALRFYLSLGSSATIDFYPGAQRPRISMPPELYCRPKCSCVRVFRIDCDCAVQDVLGICIPAQTEVTISELLKHVSVSRVQVDSALKIFGRFSPTSLPSIDITG